MIVLNCTINSKINDTYKYFYLPILKLLSILAVPTLLPHNNITISYFEQVNSLRLKSTVVSKCASKRLWGTIYFAVDGKLVFEICYAHYVIFFIQHGL